MPAVFPAYAEVAANAVHSFGTRLLYAPFIPATTDTFALIGDVKSITFNGRKLSEIDVSHFLSPGKWKEFIPGFGDGGSVSAKLNYNDAAAATLETLVPRTGNASYNPPAYGRARWIVLTPYLAQIAFYGFLQPPNPDFGEDAEVLQNIEIRVSGPISITLP